MKSITKLLLLLILNTTVYTSCKEETSIIGTWKDLNEASSLEFKSTGEFIIIDNMKASFIGNYKIDKDSLLTMKIKASDLFRDSILPINHKVLDAEILLITEDELQLKHEGETQFYKRVHS